jgi:hypothetical protein
MSLRLQHRRLIFALLCISSLLVIAYNLKTPLFRLFLNKRIEWLRQSHDINITYKTAQVIGINGFRIDHLYVNRIGNQPFIHSKRVDIRISLRNLITFKTNPIFFKIDTLELNINSYIEKVIKNKEIENRTTLNTLINTENFIKKGKPLNIKHIYRIMNVIPVLSSSEIEINNFSLKYEKDDVDLKLFSDKFSSLHGEIFAQIRINQNDHISHYIVTGNAMKFNNGMNIKVKSLDGSKIPIPFNLAIKNMRCDVDSIHFSISSQTIMHDSIYLMGVLEVLGIQTFHPKLSENEIFIKYAGTNFGASFSSSGLVLDNTTHIAINKVLLPIEVSITNSFKPKLKVKIEAGDQKASDLFESIPKGLFTTLDGIKVRGTTQFDFLFNIDFAQPDSLEFYAKLKPIDFSILSMGKEDFRMLNDTFSYIIIRCDSIKKSIILDSKNIKFRSLEQISPYVRNAVITAEDGGFYNHKGFDLEGFRYALLHNIKQQKLYRGGSTITMQLVKNLYLNRNKNLLRKAEEAIIVWLIETQKLVEKDRILEVYLNIIDWGPNINGIFEASEFYFNKDPKDLKLNEAIFLASIIPRPNSYMHNFDSLGNLKTHMESYFSFIAGKMYERGLITEEDYSELQYNVTLTGFAKYFFYNNTSIDTTIVNDFN